MDYIIPYLLARSSSLLPFYSNLFHSLVYLTSFRSLNLILTHVLTENPNQSFIVKDFTWLTDFMMIKEHSVDPPTAGRVGKRPKQENVQELQEAAVQLLNRHQNLSDLFLEVGVSEWVQSRLGWSQWTGSKGHYNILCPKLDLSDLDKLLTLFILLLESKSLQFNLQGVLWTEKSSQWKSLTYNWGFTSGWVFRISPPSR